MTLSDLSPPIETPVSVADLAAHLRLSSGFADDGAEDAILDIYIRAATTAIERRTSRALIERPMIWRLASRTSEPVYAPIAPIFAVTAVSLVSPDGASAPQDPALAILQQAVSPPVFNLMALPESDEGGYLEIAFTAGYGAEAASVPSDLRQAVLLLAAHYYEHRAQSEGDVGAIPFGVTALIEPHRPVRL